ncbi:general secretion pathway protein K [Candidatus Magnetobacterium bavaricum]|uniref:General secretion pathway protein K n=1 Tax=Candidatus Magnetobacterium bavaricum TaxID=29290 RepID=A0A0F3GVF8_9BACT|nr:general secretion pathway protein K [Candidatus Magnetobacterium bavaricum]
MNMAVCSHTRPQEGSAVLLTIFLSAIIITIGVGFNWIVKEHLKMAATFKDKSEAMVRVSAAYDSFIYAALTGKLLNDRLVFSDGTLLGTTQLAINSSALKVRDNVVISIQDSNGLIPVASGVGSEFERLVKHLDGKKNISEITDGINDWIDIDDIARPNGAEADYYRAQGYAQGNSMLQYTDELLLIKGMDIEFFRKLRPFITTLPTTGFNPNSASPKVLYAYLNVAHDAIKAITDYTNSASVDSLEGLNKIAGTTLAYTEDKDYLNPSMYLDVTVQCGFNNALYTINAGIGLDAGDFSPYQVYYWHEG